MASPFLLNPHSDSHCNDALCLCGAAGMLLRWRLPCCSTRHSVTSCASSMLLSWRASGRETRRSYHRCWPALLHAAATQCGIGYHTTAVLVQHLSAPRVVCTAKAVGDRLAWCTNARCHVLLLSMSSTSNLATAGHPPGHPAALHHSHMRRSGSLG